MKRYLSAGAWTLLLLFLAAFSASAQTIAFGDPTTLDAETGNNTSAADTFTTSINNNVQPGNVSKISLHSFLPDGSPTKIYSHSMGWFGGRDHIDIGYQSADPVQVGRQLDDMVSRGVDGVIVEWYGPATTHKSATARNTDAAAQLVMAGAEARGNIEFSIMIDQVALHTCVDPCDPTDELIRELTYVNDTYMQSPAYTRVDGRPLVTLFGVDTRYNIDWARVSAGVPGDPLLMFQDGRGKLHSKSVSSFGWVHIDKADPRNWEGDYLQWFYRLGQGDANAHTMAPVYKGFNDSMASWSLNRVLSQDCGRSWLRTWEALKTAQDPLKPIDSVQLVTWNDYEEGTEIESGIDNCVHLQAWRKGQTLHWHPIWTDAKAADVLANGPSPTLPIDPTSNISATGASSPATSTSVAAPFVDIAEQPDASIDHYTVFLTQNGYDLLPVAEAQPGIESLNLSSLPLPPGDYTAYVKAVAKSGLLNHMSRAIGFTVAPPPTTPSADSTTSAPTTVAAPPPTPSSSSTIATPPVTVPPASSSTTTTPPSSEPASTTATTPPSPSTSTASAPPSTTPSTSSTEPTPTVTSPTVIVSVTPPAEPAITPSTSTSSDGCSSAESSSGNCSNSDPAPGPGSADDKRESQNVRSADRLHHHHHHHDDHSKK